MLREKLSDAMKDAMRAKDQGTLSTVRMIMAKLKDKDIEARSRGVTDGIPDEEALSVLQGMIKQRRESIDMYVKGGPQQMDEAAVLAAIAEAKAATGAASLKEMGALMGWLKQKYAGQMDMAKASGLARKALGA
jgi:uncharacterized protein YqeY